MTDLLSLHVLGVISWMISTIAAGGGALLLIPTATFVISLKELIPALSLASIIANAQRVYLFRKHIRWDVLKFILPGVLTGALVGTYIFSKVKAPWLMVFLSLFLFHHVYRSFREPEKKSFPMKPIYFLPAAFMTAVLSSIAGATGPIMNPFYLNSEIEKEDMIGTKAVATFVMQVFKLIGYFSFASQTKQTLYYGLAIGSGALVGNLLGKKILEKITPKKFKKIVNLFILFGAFALLGKYFRG
ncbi:MAG: sulfite exporter TauE/SafE family protein [Halobacteriovoraceae bacterium]|nr:sulfite exporter TauE/SafE family protein [Halobacteriovoraceae bacterium]